LLLLKINNAAGPSGFYFKSSLKATLRPSVQAKVTAPKGSFSLEVVAKAEAVRKARLLWSTKKENTFSDKRATKKVVIRKSGEWEAYRFEFVTDEALSGLQFEPGGPLAIQSIRLFRHEAPVKLAFENALATFSQANYPVATAIDGKAPANSGWGIAPETAVHQMASFQIKQKLNFKGGTDLSIVLKQQFQDNTHSLGRFRVSVTDAPKPVSYGIPQPIIKLFEITRDQRKPGQEKQILEAYKKTDGERIQLQAALATASKPRPKDPKQTELEAALAKTKVPLKLHPRVAEFKRAIELSRKQLANPRLTAAQDLAWALINNPAFLFNY
jgi:hypothetical protein